VSGSSDRRALELLLAVLELTPEERPERLRSESGGDAELVAHVLRLLAEDDRSSPAQGALFEQPLELSQASGLLGESLGPYRLTELLGVGGMGAVYLGERRDEFEQRVAVKVVRHDVREDWNLTQLERERQILAGLDHPNIARLLDGGRTPDGTPYLVMELVEGEPITQHVRRRRLPTDAVLHLFREVCAAVEAAHRALLVHGDLKPGNILVTDQGAVKLLDFGVARLLDDDSTVGPPRALTPGYASPEQLRRDSLSVTSDVYSLGVVLYQLLTGRLPMPSATAPDPETLAKVVEETVVPCPSSVVDGGMAPLPPGWGAEIDAVVLKAIAPAPADRYQSVGELSDDCFRLLEDRPVRALPERWTYVLRKFVARHRGAVATASLAVVALAATTAIAVHQARLARARARESERQRLAAEQQRRRAESVTSFLLGLFDAANVESGEAIASDVRVTDLLDRASARLEADRKLPLETRVDLWLTLLDLEQSLDRYEQARADGLRARAELDRAGAPSPLRRGWVERGIGLAEAAAGRFDAAEAAYRRALELVESAPDRGPPELELSAEGYTAEGYGKLENAVRLELAGVLMYQDRCDEAEALIDPVMAERDMLASPEGLVDLANAANQLSGCASKEGDDERAWQLLVEARELMERGAGPRSAATATVLSNLGQEARLQGRCEDALEPLEQALDIRTELGVDERDNLRVRGSLAYCLAELGRRAQARDQLEVAIAAAETLPDGHYKKAGGYTVIGRTLSLLGEPDAARPYLEKTLQWQLEMAPDSPYVATLQYFLAENLVDLGRLREGAAELERLLPVFEQRYGAADRHTQRAARTLARAYRSLGEPEREAAVRTKLTRGE